MGSFKGSDDFEIFSPTNSMGHTINDAFEEDDHFDDFFSTKKEDVPDIEVKFEQSPTASEKNSMIEFSEALMYEEKLREEKKRQEQRERDYERRVSNVTKFYNYAWSDDLTKQQQVQEPQESVARTLSKLMSDFLESNHLTGLVQQTIEKMFQESEVIQFHDLMDKIRESMEACGQKFKQKNFRRRLCDILGVFESLGLVESIVNKEKSSEKKGKSRVREKSYRNPIQAKSVQEEKKARLVKKLKMMKSGIEAKRKKRALVTRRLNCLSKLITRNRTSWTRKMMGRPETQYNL
jgi:hypothetical protein